MTDCPKCLGTGRFACWSHIDGGVCYTCAGSGKVKATRTSGSLATEIKRFTRHGDSWMCHVSCGGYVWIYDDGEVIYSDVVKNRRAALAEARAMIA